MIPRRQVAANAPGNIAQNLILTRLCAGEIAKCNDKIVAAQEREFPMLLEIIQEPVGREATPALARCAGQKTCGQHCGGRTSGCPQQRTCTDKNYCPGRKDGPEKESGVWCTQQNPQCSNKGMCKQKTHCSALED